MRAAEQNQRNPYECGSSHSKVVVCTHFLNRGLPYVDGIS
jgi:hypothetical protein